MHGYLPIMVCYFASLLNCHHVVFLLAVLPFPCVCSFITDIHFVIVCFQSFLLLMLREGCASWLWHNLNFFTYISPLQTLHIVIYPIYKRKKYFISLAHYAYSRVSNVQLKYIRKTRLFKSIENFTTKNWKFSDKNSDIFHIIAQNIDCGYSLEPPRRGGSNEYP